MPAGDPPPAGVRIQLMLQCAPPDVWSSNHCENRSLAPAAANAPSSTLRKYSMVPIVESPSAAVLQGFFDGRHVKRMVELDLQSLRTGFDKLVDPLHCADRDIRGALNLGRITAHLCTPLVDDLVLVTQHIGRPWRIRHVGVFGDQSQGDLLAAASDHDR